jgi:hypothetical protein
VPDDALVDRGRPAGTPGDPPSRRPRASRRRWLGPGLTWLLVLAACAGLSVLYFHQSLSAPFNSDGAANVLQGQAIIQGNPLLRGWWTSDVSFYTTELPEYAVVTAIHGVGPNVVHVCGAIGYTLTVLLAALVARGRERGAAGYYRAGIALGMILPLSVTGSGGIYLENPNHAGTAVPVLALLLIVGRAEVRAGDRFGGRWLRPAAACAVLALAEVGDKLTLATATVPLAGVCIIRLVTGRRVLADGALLAAAVVSAWLAWLANLVIRALGGFDLRPVAGVALAPLGQAPANARALWNAVILLFGANQPGPPRPPQTTGSHALVALISGFHVIGLLLAAAALTAGIASLWSRRADRVAQVLVVAILMLLAFGVFSTLLRSRSYIHEFAMLLPLSAALAGRLLVPLARRLRPAAPGVLKIAPLALGAWLALSVAEVGYAATWPAVQPSQQAVASWLVAHHERAGLAGYWQAASTTVTSGGQVLVAPITLTADPVGGRPTAGPAAVYHWEASADWYQPARYDATFVIAVTDQPGVSAGLTVAEVRGVFGQPVAQHQVGQDVIMQYDGNLLARVGGTAFPGPG